MENFNFQTTTAWNDSQIARNVFLLGNQKAIDWCNNYIASTEIGIIQHIDLSSPNAIIDIDELLEFNNVLDQSLRKIIVINLNSDVLNFNERLKDRIALIIRLSRKINGQCIFICSFEKEISFDVLGYLICNMGHLILFSDFVQNHYLNNTTNSIAIDDIIKKFSLRKECLINSFKNSKSDIIYYKNLYLNIEEEIE